MKKTELIEKLETVKSVASAFLSVDDVIKMVEELEDNSFSGELGDELDELASKMANRIVNSGMDLVEDYDLSLNYKEIELDSLTLNEYSVIDIISDVMKDHFDK
jgi:predicted ribonuclease toxin of YeeF-YezG toxin-antitoxin module